MNLETAFRDIPCLEVNEEAEEFTIEFSDVEEVYDAYMQSPLVNTFIKYEILIRRYVVDEDCDRRVSRYEVYGFIYDELGESYTVTLDWIRDAQSWLKDEL